MSDVIEDDGEDHWQHLPDVVERLRARIVVLKRQVEVAYFYGMERAADDAHERLIAAEWRLIEAEGGL